MTQKSKSTNAQNITMDVEEMKSVLIEQKDFLVPVVQAAVQAILEVEMEECLQASKQTVSIRVHPWLSGRFQHFRASAFAFVNRFSLAREEQ